MLDKIKDILKNKDDLQNIKGSAWGIYNAVADYLSNAVPLRLTQATAEKRAESLFLGNRVLCLTQSILTA